MVGNFGERHALTQQDVAKLQKENLDLDASPPSKP
jgi:hypothetical protein